MDQGSLLTIDVLLTDPADIEGGVLQVGARVRVRVRVRIRLRVRVRVMARVWVRARVRVRVSSNRVGERLRIMHEGVLGSS